jgi:YYY domain-containing protein
MGAFARWYIAVEVLGVLVLPLTTRLFARLPDGGYCSSKILAILLVGFVLWTGTAYGLLRNELGGAVLAVLIVGLASASVGGSALRRALRGRGPLGYGLRRRRWVIVATEALFFVSFAGWALVRAHDPDASHTEQPMDLLFLSAVWNSPTFPPQDPWLAGYAISYYYFGYWLLATVARLAGQPPEIAYNLGQACWFGLLLVGCWGLGFNLAALGRRPGLAAARGPTAMGCGFLAALTVALIGNLQGVLEAIRVGTGLLAAQGAELIGGAASRVGTGWWWWPTSRVVSDRDLLGRPVEIIDEYPFFSYLLGDNHPHVLAMPIVVLVVTLALTLSRGRPGRHGFWVTMRGRFPAGDAGLVVVVIAAGGLVFLNPWDLPSAWGLLLAATALAAPRRAVALAPILIVGTAVAYFPYLLSAQSQILGVRPNLFHPTAVDQLLRVFGVFVPGLGALLWVAWHRCRPRGATLAATMVGLWVGAFLWFTGSVLWAVGTTAGEGWLARIPTPPGGEGHLSFAVARWASGWPTLAVLLTVLTLVTTLIWSGRSCGDQLEDRTLRFVLLLLAVALGLVVVPELGFVLDGFGTRMNTVFKLYYQAWLLLALATSYGTYVALLEKGSVRGVGVLSLALLGSGLAFPFVSLTPKLLAASRPLTLDALAHLQTADADELAAIRWVRAHTRPDSLVLQAVGASYQPSHSRLSVATGRATLLGWEGHEVQWRGSAFASQAAGRARAAREIYAEGPAPVLAQLLETWRIDYVYLGPRELTQYAVTPAAHARLERVMELAFRQGNVFIYRRRG